MTGENNPAGTDYKPKANLNENVKSGFHFDGATKFGGETRTFIDDLWNPNEKKALPAPGAYQSFSEFSGLPSK